MNAQAFTVSSSTEPMTKRNVILVLVVVALFAVVLGVQLWTGDDDHGAHQTDRDTVMDQAPVEPPSPPHPPAGRSGGG